MCFKGWLYVHSTYILFENKLIGKMFLNIHNSNSGTTNTFDGDPRDGSRDFRERFPYHIQWSLNFTAIFDGNYKFLSFIDSEKLYRQLIKKIEMEGVSGNPRNPPKTAPGSNIEITIVIV